MTSDVGLKAKFMKLNLHMKI
ncbi:hypothetical protein A2U01_0099145, partial [Trifolium medium]|nr:hypothetical protein [Trifolium medium]